MPEGVGYGPQDTASTGLNLNIIGNHCYGYSGVVTVSGSLTVMNSFQTGNYLSDLGLELHGTFAQIGQSQIHLVVKINGVEIIDTYWDPALDSAYTMLEQRRLIIPPYTELEVTLSQASGSDKTMQTTISGTIYK